MPIGCSARKFQGFGDVDRFACSAATLNEAKNCATESSKLQAMHAAAKTDAAGGNGNLSTRQEQAHRSNTKGRKDELWA